MIVPHGWTLKSVAEIAAPDARAVAIGPFGSSLRSSVYTSTGFPVIRGQNITSGKHIEESNLVYVPQEVANSFPACIVTKGDLIFPHRGAIGQAGIIGETNYLLSSSMMKLTCNSEIVDPMFVFYYFRGPGHRELMSRASTVGTPGIGQPLRSLRGIPIAFPNLVEQRAIADVLEALDDKITANTRAAATTEELLAAEFAALGVDVEPKSPDKGLPLDELIELNPSVPWPEETEPVYVHMQKLPTAGMSITDWENRSPTGGARFKNGDTLLARITPCLENRKTGYVDFLEEERVGIGSTEYIVMRSRPGVPAELSYFLAVSDRFRSFAIRHMIGTSGRQRVSANHLASFTLSRPDPYALHEFGHKAGPLFAIVRSQRDENRILSATRDTLLPQLMSGRLRVNDAVKTAEEASQ
jgi:type I restriction enzyme, S subunit